MLKAPRFLASLSPQHALVWLLFLLSGACGLIYEVLWCRQLGLIFGNTAQSLSAVLTAFMGGLALGSYVAGRLCHRLKRPLLVYGILEFLIGLYCLCLPWLFSDQGPLVPLYRSLYGETGGGALSPARFLICFAALLVPTAMMGATLPVLSHFLVQSKSTLGRTVGALYAINSLGAVLGAACAGFLLLPVLGKMHTNGVAVACNLTLGVLAILCGWGRRFGAPAPERAAASAEAAGGTGEAAGERDVGAAAEASIPPGAVQAAVLTFGVTGFAAMATQIGWTRALSLGTGSSTYAFSLIVAIFILGLSLGGMWGARAAMRTRDPLGLLAWVLALIGLLNMAVSVLLGYGPVIFFVLLAWFSGSGWNAMLAAQAIGIALLIIAPTVLMGATLPLTLQVAARSPGGAGRTVGTVYAVNTLGAILGSFFGGLVLLPVLQTQSLLELMALLYALPALGLFCLSRGRGEAGRVLRFLVPVACLVLITVLGRPWDRTLMSSGIYLLSDRGAVQAARELQFRRALPNFGEGYELLYSQEGAEATVSVLRTEGEVSLRVGGKPEASTYGDMGTQVCLTLTPEILHPTGPAEVLVIGLGSGISAGCALAPETVQRVDVVEMSPQVVEGSYYFLEYSNLTYTETAPRTLQTPKVELIINDGRNHLLLTSRRYDVIASEPSNPWMAGIGNLFTKEAFELTRARLKPGGIMCQWLQSYALEAKHFYSIVRTFHEVYPYVQLWQSSVADYLLIGSESRLELPVQRLRERLAQPAVKACLERVHFDTPAEFAACFLGDEAELGARSRKAELHTDDNMLLEFQAPRSLYKVERGFQGTSFLPCPDVMLDVSGLEAEERAELCREVDLAVSAREHVRYNIPSLREAHGEAAYALAPHQLWAIELRNKKEQAEADRLLLGAPPRSTPDPAAAVKVLTQARARSKHVRWSKPALNHALGEDAKRLMKDGSGAAALAEIEKIDSPEHRDETALLRARALLQEKQYDRAMAEVVEAGKMGRKALECTALAAEILAKSGRREEALATLENILRAPKAHADPEAAPLWKARAELLLEKKEFDEALKSARRAGLLAENDAGCARVEARILTQQGRLTEAVYALRHCAAVEPGREANLSALASALYAAAKAERGRDSGSRLAFEMLVYMRRVSRELCVLQPEQAGGWEWLCRCFLTLAEQDGRSATFHRREAERAFGKALELQKGDRSKLPADLTAAFGQ